MSVQSSIGWCTKTINPIKGCRNACWATSEHREGNCYAACMARRNLTKCERCHDFADVHPHLEVVDQVRKWTKPQRIFCGSATDLWSEGVRQEWRDAIFECMRDTPQHTWIVLTKRPEEVKPINQVLLPNLVLGVSVTRPDYADAARLRGKFKALTRWEGAPTLCVSFEPLMVHHDDALSDWAKVGCDATFADWWMIGPPTGEVARLHPFHPGDMTMALVGMLDVADSVSHLNVYVKDAGIEYLPRYMDVGQYRKLEDGTAGLPPA